MKSIVILLFVGFVTSQVLGFVMNYDTASPEMQRSTEDSISSERGLIQINGTAESSEDDGSNDFSTPSTATATPIAPPEGDVDVLEKMVYELSNFTFNGFNTTDILKRLGEIELNIHNSTTKLRQHIQEDATKLNRLNYVLGPIDNFKTMLKELEGHMQNLTSVIGNLKNGNLTVIPPQALTANMATTRVTTGRHTAHATLYRSKGHTGRSYLLDFTRCSVYEVCCKNLEDLDNDSQSINTHNTCVKLFKDRNCGGEGKEFYPGSPTNHGDFGSYNDAFSSGKPCKRS